MTKIQFRVRDNANKVIAQATLILRCKLKNGESWQSVELQTTNAGVAWLEIPDETFKLFNRQTVQIQVTKNDTELKHAKPEFKQVNDETYQVIINVENENSPSSGDESETNHDDAKTTQTT
ncbi:MAG: hypothetical protein IPI14_11345 [Polaromonas sp.]|nr:hypothetical protein [Polaromonas sp.]